MMFQKKKDEDRKPIEQEISELQRKFRVLENDKRAYSEDSQGIIRKQRATIEKLSRENRKMKSELNETRTAPNSGPEVKIALEGIEMLNKQRDKLDQKMEVEDTNSKTIAEKLEVTMETIKKIRYDMAAAGGVNASLENAKAVQKQIRILENRLHHAVQQFNESISANKKLRDEIDTLRRERVVFDDIYRKLENELQQKKKEMANIIEQANAAYEARDSAQAQMAALKQQADKEHLEFEKEWRELGRLIENDKRMKEFMRAKVRGPAGNDAKIDTIKDEMKKKLPRPDPAAAKLALGGAGNQEKLHAYEEAFSRIQAATGICEIDELVQKFIIAEDENFSFFKYNSLLREDIEKLDAHIGEHSDEKTKLSGSSSKKEDMERTKQVEILEEKLKDIEDKAEKYENKTQESQTSLSHIRTGIETLFSKMQCSPDDLPPGAAQGISEENMMSYLAVIEHRTNDLLKLYDALESDDQDYDPARTRPPPGSTGQPPVRLPSTVEEYSDDEDEDDEDDQRPFTRDELKAKTLKGITKRQKKSRTKGNAQEK
jgi:chromosome segregation ATPase